MYSSTLYLTSALDEDGDGWLRTRTGGFTPGKQTRHPFYMRLGGPPAPVWMGAKNPAANGVRSPDRPDRGQSLHRLHHSDPNKYLMEK